MEITATIDGKVKIVTEASIRRHLKLEDSDGISNLPTTKIFEQLALMGSKKTAWEQFSSNIATAIICLATNRTFNFSKLIFDGSTVPVESHHTPTGAPSTSQPHLSPTLRSSIRQETEVPQPSSPPHTNVADEAASTRVDVRHRGAATTVTSLDAGQSIGNIDKTLSMPYDSPLSRGHILGSDEGRTQHNEFMDLVTKLSDRVIALETDLKQTKKVYGAAFIKLIKKVKRLEKKDKLSKSKRKLRLVLSDEEDFTTANVPVTTAGAEISTASPEVKTAGDSVDDIAAESLVYIRRSAAKTKDKGKGIMEESESAMTKTKRQQEQERLGLETAVRLQEEFDEEERQRIARVHEAARSFTEEEWEDIRERVEASEELVQRLQIEEREKYSEDDQAKMLVDLINQRKRYFAAQKAEAKRNKPMTQAQQRTYMSNYIKHMGNYKLQQLKRLSFDEIKDLFETTMRRANTFVPIETEIRRGVPELVADSSQAAVTESTEAGGTKRAAEEELGQQSSKKQKPDELSQEELQQLMIIVPEEGMNIEALQTKYLIIDWEVYTEDSRMDDLVKLWSLVQESFNTTKPTEDKEIEIWVELKRLFEPDADDELWKSQKHIHDITWRLYDTCGVHHVSTKDGVDIYMLVEREYPLSRGVLTQMLVAKLLVEQNNKMSRELLRKIFMQIKRLRR
ncbi:hypothetical protein Tco_0782868 [Tanacetum coccineum]